MNRTLLSAILSLSIPVISAAQNTVPVSFDLNYSDAENILSPLTVKVGNALPLQSKPRPEREGYRFAGWYTSPDCREGEEWLFGNNSVGFYTQPTDSMAVKGEMTLYAKWVSPTPVRTAQDLDDMRNDLSGWYVLENDIDLSGILNWVPVGEYEAHYEFAPGEWWVKAFKGRLEGNGHTIRGLHMTQLLTDKSGLFGACANAQILGVKMEDTLIEMTAEKPYVAPLAGILKQDDGAVAEIRSCNIANTTIKVRTTNKESTFHSFTGLCGGAWGGYIGQNTVSGKMDLQIAGEGGGELYVGAFLGEAYNDPVGCVSDYEINITFTNPKAKDLKAYIGALQASATNVDSSVAMGSINVSGFSGSKEIYVGGLIGSERYGTVKSSRSSVRITEKKVPSIQIGGIVGEFNQRYGMIGAAVGTKTTILNWCTFTGKVTSDGNDTVVFGEICGGGQPEPLSSPWGLSMDYSIRNCKYEPAE